MIVVEFLGIPRLRSGRADLAVEASNAREAMLAVAARCPLLRDLAQEPGKLPRHYLLSLDGQVFLEDLTKPLQAGSRLLLLSADAGG